MTIPFWTRVRTAFEAAAEAAPAEAEAILHVSSGGDAEVMREARALLARDDIGYFDVPPPLAASGVLTGFGPGEIVGSYRMVRLVGRGGMGEVYEATRATEEFHKRVAIKVLHPGAAHPELIRRFAQERRILAGLEDPHIASLLDGGVLPDGRPFLVMEFVEGESITAWCTREHRSLAQRLDLFRQVCSAVSHAHRNLVVHRDLKPGNILVTANGTAKLLDFGIAKVVSLGADGTETATRAGGAALTPEYAAPEQVAGGTVTTATDIYALGLLFYEMLTGDRPFRAMDPLARLDGAKDPPLASQSALSGWSDAEKSEVRRALRGDLDAITLKAMRAEPRERYGSADHLADDIHRHLRGLPVDAMRAHRGYVAGKFIRRQRVAIGALAFVIVAVAAGAVSSWRESRRTRIQQARAEATSQFLTEMLGAVDPAAAGKDILMTEVLDSAAARISRDSTLEPDVEAALQTAIGMSYRALGRITPAEPHLRRALELRARAPNDRIKWAQAYRELALLYDGAGEYPRADSLYRRGLELLPERGDSAVESVTIDLLTQRARLQSIGGDLAGAEAILTDLVVRNQAEYGIESAHAANALSQLGVTLIQRHKFAEADSVTREALRLFRLRYQPPHPEIGKTLGRLATIAEQWGKPAPADSAYEESLQMLGASLGPDHPDVAWIRGNYAGFLLDNHDWDGAIRQTDSILGFRGRTIPETHPTIGIALQTRGLAFAGRGDHVQAESALRASLELRRKYLEPAHWMIGSAESVLGAELVAGAKRSEGLRLLREGCRHVVAALGLENPMSKKALGRLAQMGESGRDCG